MNVAESAFVLQESELKASEEEEIFRSNDEKTKLNGISPIRYSKLWEIYKKRLASSVWTVEIFDPIIRNDLISSASVSETIDQQEFIKIILAFLVGNCAPQLCLEVMKDFANIYEANCFYAFRMTMRNIHFEIYSTLFETFTKEEERSSLTDKVKVSERKSQFIKKWLHSDNTIAEKLLAYVCSERIFYSASFFSIFWLKKYGLMKSLTISNNLIYRDEDFNLDFSSNLYSNLNETKQLSQIQVHSLINEAVDIEKEFISSLPTERIELDRNSLNQYVEFISDKILVSFGYEKYFNSPENENIHSWIDNIVMSKSGYFWKIGLEPYLTDETEVEENNLEKKHVLKLDEYF